MKKTYDSKFKSRIALEALRGDLTIAELASKYQIHPNLVQQWKKKLLGSAAGCFMTKAERKAENKPYTEPKRLVTRPRPRRPGLRNQQSRHNTATIKTAKTGCLRQFAVEFHCFYDRVSTLRSYLMENHNMNIHTNERWLSTSDLCQYLSVSNDTLYRWIQNDEFPAQKIGKRWKAGN